LHRATAAGSSSNPLKDKKQLMYKGASSSRTNSYTNRQSTQHKTVMSRVVAAQNKVLQLRDIVTIEHYAVD
jgi:hypothetical protein